MNKINKTLVTVGGILYLAFGAFHMTFFRVFKNDPDFKEINPILGKIVQMLNVGIILFFLSLGIVLLVCRKEILTSRLGRAVLILSSVFFFIRGAAEFFFPNYVLALVATMLACSVLYLIPVFNRK